MNKNFKTFKTILSTGDINLLQSLIYPLEEYDEKWSDSFSIKEDITSLKNLINDLKEIVENE
jgi:hypothetical protein